MLVHLSATDKINYIMACLERDGAVIVDDVNGGPIPRHKS